MTIARVLITFKEFAFRKGHSTQDALLRVIESWRKCLDASGIVGTILMDLSKAYDCILHDLLIAKLEACWFDRNSLIFMYSYLTGHIKIVNVGSSYSSIGKIKIGVLQGSVLVPMLFNIFINDLLLIDLESEICNCADDNTIYARSKTPWRSDKLLRNWPELHFIMVYRKRDGSKPEKVPAYVPWAEMWSANVSKYWWSDHQPMSTSQTLRSNNRL